MHVTAYDGGPLAFANHGASVLAQPGDAAGAEDRREGLHRPRPPGHRRDVAGVPVGADRPHGLACENALRRLLDQRNLLGQHVAEIAQVAERAPAGDARDALLRLPAPNVEHPVRGLLRLLAVHRGADADLELADPAVRRCDRPVGVAPCGLERVHERCPPRPATTGEAIRLVRDHAVDLAVAD